METRILKTNEEKEMVENLRAEVLHLDYKGSYYLNELLNNKKYALVTFDDEEMVAGCYFYRFEDILMIDQLFVKEKYQNTGLKLGRELVNKLISSKDILEELLGGKLELCKIESNNKKAHDLYSKIGFSESSYDNDTFYRGI